MFERFALDASTFAGDIDNLILLVTVLVGFWFLVAEGVFFWLLFKFRARDGKKALYITGEKKEETKWISIPHGLVLVCDVFIIVGAIRVWTTVKLDLPPPDATVRVISQQWAWSFVHPGPDGKLDTADDVRTADELHVQDGKTYHFLLESKDVLHSLSIPAFRLKQDAIPGRIVKGWFKPTKVGRFDIQCAEICGIGHGIMAGRIVVDTPDDHAKWMKASAPVQVAPAASAEEHSAEGASADAPAEAAKAEHAAEAQGTAK